MGDAQDALSAMYRDQREELAFRRKREQEIFAWSSSLMAAIIGWALLAPVQQAPVTRFGTISIVLFAAAALVFGFCAAIWQLNQRVLMAGHQRALADIADERGWFAVQCSSRGETVFPPKWREWGRHERSVRVLGAKFWATASLGAVAFACILMRG